jgi:uncharacterized protein involved in exopolysaccharide biosynthesis
MQEYDIVKNQVGESEVDFIEMWKILTRSKRFIIKVVLISGIISLGYSFLATKKYKAESLVYMSTFDKSGGGIPKELLGIQSLASGLLGSGSIVNNSSKIIGLIASRSLLDRVIKDQGLNVEFENDNDDELRAILREEIETEESNTDYLKISLEYKNPEKARDIVNSVINNIDKLNNEINNAEISSHRKFLEVRLAEVKLDLAKTEETLNEFQKNNKILEPTSQASLSVSTLSVLNTILTEAETQLGIKSGFLTENDTEIIKLKMKINQIKKHIADVEIKKIRADPQFIKSLDEYSDIGLTYLRLQREVKIQQALFELLTSEYELEKIKEKNNSQIIAVVDYAVAPTLKSKPKRKLIVISTVVLSLFFTCIFALTREAVNSYKVRVKSESAMSQKAKGTSP